MACQAVTNGFKCEKGTVTLSSTNDPNNPLTTHNWTIDGTQKSTAAQFTESFLSTGLHSVVHSGANACAGTCSKTATLEIVDVITPPPSPTTSTASKGPAIAAVVAVVVLGVLGIAMMGKKKK